MDDSIDWIAASDPNPRTPVDQTTGLGNRMALHQRLAEVLDSGETNSSAAVALLFVDLDNFRMVNDLFGHAAGDGILCVIAKRLEGVAGTSDRAYRLGGDEFVVLPVGSGGSTEPSELATSVLVAVRRPFDRSELDPAAAGLAGHHLTCSVGVATARPGDSSDDLLGRADGAMSVAKDKHGLRGARGDSFAVFDEIPEEDVPPHLRNQFMRR